MRLIYRGASYEYNPSLEARENDIFARNRESQQRCHTLQERNYPLVYRGATYTTAQVGATLAAPARRSSQPLIYRGVTYTRDLAGKVGMSVAVDRVVVPGTAKAAKREISRVHQENLRRNLERRLSSAKQRGDQTLVNLLEAESRELAL